MTLPPPGTVVVVEATRPDGLPSLRRATLVGSDDRHLGLHLRAGMLADLRLGPGTPLRLHWSATTDHHGNVETSVTSAYARVGSEGRVDGAIVAHLAEPVDDRRGHARARVPGTVVWEGGEGSLVDMSAGGLRIETATRIDGPVAMTIDVGGRRLDVTAEPLARTGGEVRLVVQGSTDDLDEIIPALVSALTLRPA